MMERVLANQEQSSLRNQNVIWDNEIAIQVGDLHVAENVISRSRRIITIPDQMIQETKVILRD